MQKIKSDYSAFLEEKLILLKKIIPLTSQNEWKQSKEKNGIKIHLKKDNKSQLYIVRSEGVVKSPISEVMKLLNDNNRVMEYDNTLESIKVIEEISNQSIVYTITKKPGPFIDKRDCITVLNYKEEDGSIIYFGGSIDYPNFPINKGNVRGEVPLIGYLLTLVDDLNTKIVYVIHVDPKGLVPKFMINAFCEDQAMTILNIKNILEGGKPKLGGTLG